MAKPILPKLLGYTLIEILVVLFIISIVTSLALLSISHNENKRLAAFANDLAQVLSLAEEEAILKPAIIGLHFNGDIFQFKIYDAAADKKTWVLSDDAILGQRKIPGDMAVKLNTGGETPSDQPQVIISTNGELTPFVIYVGKKGEAPRYKVIGEADGSISSHAVSS